MFKILVAAPQSLVNEIFLAERVKYFTQNKVDWELHTISRKVTCKMICSLHDKVVVHKTDFFAWGKDAVGKAYDEVIEYADAAIIFWDGEAWHEKELIRKCIERPVKHVVVKYESLKQELERTKPEKKAGRKKITVPLSKESRERYFAAHEKWYKREYPTGFADGFYSKPKMPVINAGSRMDFFITNFLVWEGWSATKVNNMGRKVNGSWVASSTKKGTFDLSCSIKGRSIKIETKHGSDRPSEDQLKMQARERKAGAVAEFVGSIEDFFLLYDKILNDEI